MKIETLPGNSFASPQLHAQGLYIGGEWLPGSGIPVVNPATAQTLADVPDADVGHAKAAVDAAEAAAPQWRATPLASAPKSCVNGFA